MRRFLPDPLVLTLVAVAAIAAVLPARGTTAEVVGTAAQLGVALVFFLHGARLVPANVIAGLRHWRLHLTVLVCTFGLFPLLVLPFGVLVPHLLSQDLYIGFLFLGVLPSTIQSAISFTSVAGGNVSAAVCAASASNMLGVILTPLLAALLLHTDTAINAAAIEGIALQLLLPFLAGQLVQRWVGAFMRAHRRLLGLIERCSILIVVYGAFSSATVSGAWGLLAPVDLVVMFAIVATLLGAILVLARVAGRVFGFPRADEIVVVFCGSTKSIGSGLPMANILFSGGSLGLVAVPMIFYHQLQLMLCAYLAARYARAVADVGRADPAEAA